MKHKLFLMMILPALLLGQGSSTLWIKKSDSLKTVTATTFVVPNFLKIPAYSNTTGRAIGSIRYNGGLIEYYDGSSWKSLLTTSVDVDGEGGWSQTTRGNVYNTTPGDIVHVRSSASDTTGTAKVNVYGSLYANGAVTLTNRVLVGSGADTISINSTDGILLSGTATAWDDITVPLVQTKQGSTDKPLWVADSGAFKFIADSTEILSGSVEMPHGWKTGSNIHPHIHYIQTSAGDTGYFSLKWKWHSLGNGGMDGAWHYTTLSSMELTYTSGNMQQLLEGAPMDATGKGLSSIIVYELKRKNNGGGLTNMHVFNLGFHYEIDSFGSRQEIIK